jgi:hypothetical protein
MRYPSKHKKLAKKTVKNQIPLAPKIAIQSKEVQKYTNAFIKHINASKEVQDKIVREVKNANAGIKYEESIPKDDPYNQNRDQNGDQDMIKSRLIQI